MNYILSPLKFGAVSDDPHIIKTLSPLGELHFEILYTAGTKLSIYLVLLAAFTNCISENDITIKLFTNMSIDSFITICLKIRRGLFFENQLIFSGKRVLKGAYF